ncbi:hypothetical protein tpqmel_1001 [Candidatus Gastranaerophilus sp. (ex Termes propinquus)]|nr:hypothetical protein tpqmel_1001 [Candidatus Gastranaerophilus sp. (ex Termes propinquus)]
MVIKKIFGFTAVHARITHQEKAVLTNCGMDALECSSVKQINQELALLKKWSNSSDLSLIEHADYIFEIRIKELKYLHASNYTSNYTEISDGHRALEKYVEFVAG